MDAGLLSAFINNLVARLFVLAEVKYKLYEHFEEDLCFLRAELPMITSAIDAQLSGRDDLPLYFQVNELHQLAQEMEDCIDRIMYRASKKQQPWYRINSGSRIRSRNQEAQQRNERYNVPCPSYPELTPSSSDRHIAQEDLVGIDAPLNELLEHLAEPKVGQPKQLNVISIVGFCGLGKTVLAQELYDRQRNPEALLMDILRQVHESPPVNSDARQLSMDLRNRLNNKRYFIVIDDMRLTDQWNGIKSAFPHPQDVSSRIVVTTRFQPVANTCCATNGHIHKMIRLDKEYSKKLLLMESCLQECSSSLSKAILDKCDGQPLALAAVGQFIKSRNLEEQPKWEGVCKEVRFHLDSNDTLKRIHQVLTHDYTSLPSHAVKACLLYFAMFPSDHQVRTKRLMRRWLAEGFVEPTPLCGDPEAQSFKVLIDRNIIQSTDVSNHIKVKTCKTYGMMHEYTLRKSLSENIIALFDDGKLQPRQARRLCLHDSRITYATDLEFDLSLVRSLIIIGQAGKGILDFRKYHLLRVLDLEQCTDLQNDHLKEATNLPKEIKKLKLLETLDLRRTNVNILTPEVIELPNLVHLFGKFKLANNVLQSKLKKFVSSGKCKLQTLSGFLVDGGEGFAELMVDMKKLRKVKIWCESSATTSRLSNVKKAVQKFIHDVEDPADDPRSLSIHFEGCSEDLLDGLEAPCYLRSLKLQGILLKLPVFVTALRRLRELCLQSTRLTADLLTALGDLKDLIYLKLVADELDPTTFRDRALPSLLCLCFVVKNMTFPTIEEGALPILVSLQLLCENMDGRCNVQIKAFTRLREVILYDKVNTDIKANWEQATKEHQNRPKVLLLKSADPPEGAAENKATGSALPEGRPAQQINIQVPPAEPKIAFDSSKGHHVACVPLTGLSISGNCTVPSL
ncbi:hypothetical protein BS78_05G074300 [Paspalum vaginatum]|nr:hypothetical protein BS78_05G074300 [Paspalum vaginatum]